MFSSTDRRTSGGGESGLDATRTASLPFSSAMTEALAALLDGVEDTIVVTDLAGRILLINEAGRRMYGSDVDLRGAHAFDLLAEECRAGADEGVSAVLAQGVLRNRECLLVRHDGTRTPIEMTVSLLRAADGAASGFMASVREIGERERAKGRMHLLLEIARTLSGPTEQAEAIDHVQRRTAEVLGCSAVVTILWDEERGVFRALGKHTNIPGLQQALDALAYTPNDPEVRKLAAEQTVHVHAHQVGDKRAPAFRELGVSAVTWTQLIVRGRVRGALVALSLEEARGFDDREVDLLEGVAHQLALALEARFLRRGKKAEAEVGAALARAGHELMLALGHPHLADRLCQLSADLLATDTCHTLLFDQAGDCFSVAGSYGYPQELSESFRVMRLPTSLLARVRATFAGGDVVAMDFAAVPSDDPVVRAASGLGLHQGLGMALYRGTDLAGFHFACRFDPRARFTAEQQRIAGGLGRLASITLQHRTALDALEAANRRQSDLVGAISHELRTPLSVIMGYTDMLLDGSLGDLAGEQTQALARIDQSAHNLFELISGMLDLSRLESGRVRVDPALVDLADILQQIEVETAELRRPGVELRWSVDGVAGLRSDILKLKIVLKNLITNALKFTAAGAVEAAACSDGERVHIRVRDSGCGIAAETLPLIFEAFRQGSDRSTNQGGVGLGLYIVRRMVDVLRGEIQVESEPGRGTTFDLSIPLILEADDGQADAD